MEREPIAIIGIGCRFPGGANTPDTFWRLLCDGVDAITEIPVDRWNVRSFYDPEPGTPGKTYARWGGFIEGVDQFDAGFFGISPREAAQMDPQQRLLLEVAYEAIEDGGQTLDRLAGSQTGVFIGISTNDYANIQSTTDDKTSIDTYSLTGVAVSIAANRISYCFNLKGPSIALDTACSSSLVAVHLACRSIWNQESALALAGGVNVIICPEYFIGFSRLAMLSPQGRCKAFDASGDGFVRGEGVGVVLLKPLSRARADGDLIYAVIRGTAVNQDGRTSGITVPSQEAQEAMLREAYQQAGVAPEQVRYVEAHGTGTLVGDPIEANALGAVLAANRPDGDYCVIGSVKTNIGHLEAGAGIAGLIKVALMLKHGLIPPNLHFKNPNPLIDFEKLKLRVPQRLEPWPEGGGMKYAGVNSFGFGGTNAHVVLSEAPPSKCEWRIEDYRVEHPKFEIRHSEGAYLLPLSARSPEALKSLAQAYVDFLKGPARGSELSLREIGYNLSLRRTHHDHRLSLVVHTQEEFIKHLEAFLAGETRPGMHTGHLVSRQAPKVAFVFSGQGPQWWAMGRQLLEQEPVFRDMIEQCDALLGRHASWSLMEELTADEERSRLQETSIAQPAIFALQVALAALWRSWGVEPEAVVGHSVGEAAAAHIAGVLSLEDAVKVIFHRGRCMDLASSKGKMLAAGVTLEEAEKLIAGYEDRISIAAINSPSSVTLSGDAEVLSEMSQLLEQRGAFWSFLKVNYAFHSPQMDPVRDELVESLQGLTPKRATKLIFSTVTGQMAEGPEFDVAYWWQNVRKPVRFAQAIEGLIEAGCSVFLELSPHPVLAQSVTECLQGKQAGLVLPSLRRREEERLHMLGSLGALYTSGCPLNWERVYPGGGHHIQLPRYPWQHESYWHESEEVKEARLGACAHPLLGRRLRSANPSWSVEVSRSAFPYLQDHKVQGHVVFPAAAYLEMVLAAAKEIFGAGTYVVEDIDLYKALFLPDGGEAPTLQTTFYPDDSSFAIHSRLRKSDEQWTLHVAGKIGWEPSGNGGEPVNVEELRANCFEEISKGVCYERLRKRRGLQYGASFQGIEQIWRRDGEAVGVIDVPKHLQAEVGDYLIHPAIFDACLQVLFETLASESLASRFEVFLPVQADQVRFFNRPDLRVWSHARLAKEGAKTLEGSIRLFDQEGNVLVEIRGLKCQSVDTVRDASSESMDNWIYEFEWQLKARPEAKSSQRRVDFLPPAAEIEARLQAESNRLSEEVGGKRQYQAIESDLNQLCSAYIIKALRALGWDVAERQRVTVGSLAQELRVSPQYHRLLRKYLDLLGEDGWLKQIGSEWEVCESPPAADTDQIWRSILQRYPAFSAELILTRGCGERLAEVLQGTVDPLRLIFPEGSLITTEHLYQDSPSCKIYNLLVAKALSIALERLPEGRKVRLLEVGSGTGGLTSYLLPVLPADQVEYVFSDISPFFLQKAEQKFRDYPFLTYQLLDIEKDPAEQGFELHSFDFILAANVLHATSDLRQTLSHVEKLLVSEGLFILLEIDNPGRWVNLVFGLIEGWWRFSDADLRPSSPLLSREKWVQLLESVGFTNPIAVSEMGGRDGQSQCVIAARGPVVSEPEDSMQEAAGAPVVRGEKSWLILADRGGVGQKVAEFLRSRGDRAVLIFAGEEYRHIDDEQFQVCPDRPEDFQQLLNDALTLYQSAFQGVIHCWSLDSPPTEETTLTSLERSEALGCHSVMHLIQAWAGVRGLAPSDLWLITRGAQPVGREITAVSVSQSPLWGLGRVIINEHRDFRCKMVNLSQDASPIEIQSLCEELINGDEEDEIALRGPARYVLRLRRASLSQASKRERRNVSLTNNLIRLETTAPGIFDALAFREMRRSQPGPGEVEIQVFAATLNFRDVMKALGIYPIEMDDSLLLGDECAGRIVAVGEGVEGLKVGDEVIAIAPGSLSSYVITRASLVMPKPGRMSFEEAATIPIAFLTASYALRHLGRMSRGERVLIHAAAGGVGLAAVQIAQQVGAEVFATAGSSEKRAFLSALGVRHVMDSRSLSFADEIREITGGQGVDLVLNSLAGEAIPKGLSCLAPYGRFLEIGKRDIYQNSKLGLRTFKKNLSFFALDLSQVIADRPELINRQFGELMQLFEEKQLHPLPYRVFPLSDVVNAFRHMAQARHIGKIVISLRNQEIPVEPLADQTLSFRPNATYLITGGLGGFGLAVAQWMVENGARHLVLMGRSGVTSDEARQAVQAMEAKGGQIVVARGDVSREEDVARLLSEIEQSLPPLRGIAHAAMVVDDGILLRLDRERFKKVMEPKVQGAWNLHRLTLNKPLDFFLLFSSVATIVGSPGQGNYAAANAFLDALAHHRRLQNLPALSINWGHLADTGYVARHKEIGEHLDSIGIKGFTSKQAVEILGRLLLKQSVQVGVVNADWRQWAKYGSVPLRFSLLVSPEVLDQQRDEGSSRLRDRVLASQLDQRPSLIESYLKDQVARVLGTSASRLESERPLSEMGLDSLMMVELRNKIERELGVSLPAVELMRGPSISTLSQVLLDQLTGFDAASRKHLEPEIQRRRSSEIDAQAAEELLQRIDQLSGEEVDALLTQLIDEGELSTLVTEQNKPAVNSQPSAKAEG